MAIKHNDLHVCDHPTCTCFWCRVSRRERMESIVDVLEIAPSAGTNENGDGDLDDGS